MSTTSTEVDVACPVRTVYDQWTQFEDFPEFMEGVESVRQLDDTTLVWNAQIAGQRRSWKARITEQVPDSRISWESIDGARNAGIVQFEPLGDERTRVFLDLDFEPEGLVEAAGDKLGFVKRRAEGDLERFKTFIESRRSPTGAWRGTVRDGESEQVLGSADDELGSARTAGMVAGMGTGLNAGMGAGIGPETAATRPAGERTALPRDDDFVRDTTTGRASRTAPPAEDPIV
jgi:ribosome-associated toxin RatA of RatAB toxin-antitoxin module